MPTTPRRSIAPNLSSGSPRNPPKEHFPYAAAACAALGTAVFTAYSLRILRKWKQLWRYPG